MDKTIQEADLAITLPRYTLIYRKYGVYHTLRPYSDNTYELTEGRLKEMIEEYERALLELENIYIEEYRHESELSPRIDPNKGTT